MFKIKDYKFKKIKNYIKKKHILLMASKLIFDSIQNLNFKQLLNQLNFNSLNVETKKLIKTLEFSIFKYLKICLTNSILFLSYNINNYKIKSKFFQYLNDYIYVLNLKLNNKFYSFKQINNIIEFNYYKTVNLLYNYLNKTLNNLFEIM